MNNKTISGMEKLNSICHLVKGITKKEFDEIDKTIESQILFIHPLKGAKQKKINNIGRHNHSIWLKIRETKAAINNKSFFK